MFRPRTRLLTPKAPGGCIENPPPDCPKAMTYCPNPAVFEVVMVVEYVRCGTCKIAKKCPTKTEYDKLARRRIRNMKNGEES